MDNLTENQKSWLSEICDAAIAEHGTAAGLERAFAAGTSDERERRRRFSSAEEHERFADWLEKLKNDQEAMS